MSQGWMSPSVVTLQINSSDYQKLTWLCLLTIKAIGWVRLRALHLQMQNGIVSLLKGLQWLRVIMRLKSQLLLWLLTSYQDLVPPWPSAPPLQSHRPLWGSSNSLCCFPVLSWWPRIFFLQVFSWLPLSFYSHLQGHVLRGLLWSPALWDLLASQAVLCPVLCPLQSLPFNIVIYLLSCFCLTH